MNSRERILATINHREPDRLAVDFGATSVTGIHCLVVEKLREYYGLEKRPVVVTDPYQMLGEVDSELREILGCDCVPIGGPSTKFGTSQIDRHLRRTPWGQEVLISSGIDLTPAPDGNIYIYPQNDRTCQPSGVMPGGCFFFNAIERQPEIDEDALDPGDNLEEYGPVSDTKLEHFIRKADEAALSGKAVVASFGGTALGDVSGIPGTALKQPKGIRSVAEWYMSTIIRPDYIKTMFDRQTDIAIENLKKYWAAIGSKVDVVSLCGADFGTQDSQFCSVETFRELWLPYYQKLTGWIHSNTTWKIFKHSCGSVVPLIPSFIDAGFDILNPVQINAKDMDPTMLKREFGKDLVFWGGGIDTQKVLPFGTPQQVREQVRTEVEILGAGGGYVFNTVHDIQANVPVENVVAMIDELNEIRK